MIRAAAFLLLISLPLPSAELDSRRIDSIVEKSRAAWSAPGVSVAIVKDDQVILLKGYGVKAKGKSEAVTADTRFAIGSATKAFTTAAMAMLADEGKLDWDDPVRKHVDYFHLADPLADGLVTLRDLVCHRTGLARHDELWYNAPWTREEIIRRISAVPLDKPFRSAWQYQNMMFLVAGTAAGHASGMNWDELIQRRIFTPLGMNNSDTSASTVEKSPDHAMPHSKAADGQVSTIKWRNIDDIAPAGSINSSARDMAAWVRFQLDRGVAGGKRLISEKNFAEMQTPQMAMRPEDAGRNWNPLAVQHSYALGWFIGEYRGYRIVSHGGAIDGFRTSVTLVPSEKLGIVVMANLGNDNMPEALRWEILDSVLGLPARDWDTELIEHFGRIEKEGRADAQRLRDSRVHGTKPSLELPGYAGKYENPGYGELVIQADAGVLTAVWRGGDPQKLEHFQYDTFMSQDAGVTQFKLNARGTVSSVTMYGAEFQRK